MPVHVDDRQIEPSSMPIGCSVGRALEVAKGMLAPAGRMVFEIRCDGRDYAPHEIESLLPRPVAELNSLQFVSGRPEDVVVEALAYSRDALGETFAAVRHCAELLASSQIARAMETLIGCLSIWGRTHEAIVQGGQLAALDYERLTIEGRPVIDCLGDIVRRLRAVRDAVEARDYVLLADILQYELDDMLCGWEAMLGGLIAHLRTPKPLATPAAAAVQAAAIIP